MANVVVINQVTLDGVMQSPARPDEDVRGGFAHGGWAVPGNDELMAAKMGERIGENRAFLFGLRTYDEILATWNARGGPYKDSLMATPKYVASSSTEAKLAWPNSHLVAGDVPAAVAGLKQSVEGNLVIMGSGQLIRSLLPGGLIDEFFLMIHPLILGSGQRLFEHAEQVARLRLIESTVSSTGVVLAVYRRE